MNTSYLDDKKLNQHLNDGFRILAKMIAREFTTKQSVVEDLEEYTNNSQNIKYIQNN